MKNPLIGSTMREDYYLKVGGAEVLSEGLLAQLSSNDDSIRQRTQTVVAERLKEMRVRIGTLLKTDNVGFLLGAGASIAAGGIGLASIPPTLEHMLHLRASDISPEVPPAWLSLFYETATALTKEKYTLNERRLALEKDIQSTPSIPMNLEAYQSHLHMWSAGVAPAEEMVLRFADSSLSIKKDTIRRLIDEINWALTLLVDLPAPGKEDALRAHKRLVKKVLTRPLNLRRANVFTLNYDTLLEQAADGEGTVLVDGFVGTLRRVFRPDVYDLDFYFPAQTTEGRVHRFDRALHLYKLHGSINWHRSEPNWENPYGLYATFFNQTSPEANTLIYPSPLKYGQALDLPYSELFRRFGVAIAQAQSVLFTMGYGFGDDHVNALIRQALAVPSFTLVIVDPKPRSPFVRELDKLGDERVWIVAGRELGTFERFVDKLMPDLRDEQIAEKVMATYNRLASPEAQIEPAE